MGLYSKIIDLQKLSMAWDRVRKNKPACGADNVTWEMFDRNKREQLKQLNIRLQEHEYTVMPVRMVTLYKEEKLREVALYCMCDKVVQQSVACELVKLYDNTFPDSVCAYRPGKSALAALEMLSGKIRSENYEWVLRLDIEHFFDTISMGKLCGILRQRIKEDDVLELIAKICTAPGITETGELKEKRSGIHQGSALAPVLSNLYLAEFDREMEMRSDFYIRYSDDMIMLSKSRQKLEEICARAALLLEKLGLALNQSKTALLSIESGFDFLGYHFDKQGKTVPEKAEAGLQERLEAIWLTDRPLPLNEKLKKGAEVLGGWEQYYNEEREIASSYEFAVVAYMVWNKETDIERLRKNRESFRNSNREICLYLCSFWEKFSRRRMALYEMEDFQGIADMDRDIEIPDIYMDELSGLYRKLMDGETEELLVNIMQVYSDVGAFTKAAAIMDRVSRLHALYGKESRPITVGPAEEEEGESEPIRLSEEQIRKYMENFVGREDTYVIQDVDKHGRLGYIQVMEPLTEEVLQEHFCGRRTVGTYVQRSNGTAKFMVIDIDISKKILLEVGNNDDMLQSYMQKAANQVQRFLEELRKLGLYGWTEESGCRGYHVWILFAEWVSVRYLNMLQDILEERMGKIPGEVTLEFFPNKSRLKPGKMGQAIKLPYGYHGKTGRQSRLLDEDFHPLSNPGEFIANMGKYTNLALKRILNTAASSKSATVRESRVDEDISAFGSLSDSIQLVLKRCNLMRYLCQKARTTGYLSHFERMSVLYVFGHMGDEGAAFVHRVMEFTLNYQYSVTEKFISRIPAKPVSCLKLRDQYQKITAEYGCSCNFNRTKDCYPSPVLHAIQAGKESGDNITVPTSRTLSKEKESMVLEELNINKRVQGITGKILELKRQKRGLDKNIVKLEQELERIFDGAGIECLEIEFGMLVRRKREQGYEWIVEV